jgi:AraC-like DNA-binding protein
MSASTLTSWGRAVHRALLDAGCEADALFREAGLDPAALEDPQARYPIARSRRLWALAVAATGDPAFGLQAARRAHITSFHALGFAVMASLSLRDAFERCARYLAVVSDAASLRLEDRPGQLVIHIEARDDESAPSPEAIDAFAAVFVRMARARLGRQYAPLSIRLARPVPPDAAPWTTLFRCPVAFAAEGSALLLSAADADRRPASGRPKLAAANEAIAERLLAARAQGDRQGDLLERVQRLLAERLPQGDPGEAAIAEALHLSLRSLQRRLAEHGSRYGELLGHTRETLAKQYLADGRHSISEIAYLLGFGDASSFTRAFKRWTGRAPSQFR